MGLPVWDTVRLTIEGIDGLEGTSAGKIFDHICRYFEFIFMANTLRYTICDVLFFLSSIHIFIPFSSVDFSCMKSFKLPTVIKSSIENNL